MRDTRTNERLTPLSAREWAWLSFMLLLSIIGLWAACACSAQASDPCVLEGVYRMHSEPSDGCGSTITKTIVLVDESGGEPSEWCQLVEQGNGCTITNTFERVEP